MRDDPTITTRFTNKCSVTTSTSSTTRVNNLPLTESCGTDQPMNTFMRLFWSELEHKTPHSIRNVASTPHLLYFSFHFLFSNYSLSCFLERNILLGINIFYAYRFYRTVNVSVMMEKKNRKNKNRTNICVTILFPQKFSHRNWNYDITYCRKQMWGLKFYKTLDKHSQHLIFI
jgi:hypothetical protein